MITRTLVIAALFPLSLVWAGEIVIIQPAGNETRSEKAATRSADQARRYTSGQSEPIVVEDGEVQRGSASERSSRDAQDYLRSPGDQTGETTIILRSAPLNDAEKARQRAASYVQSPGALPGGRPCGDVSLTIGTVGDKTVVERNGSVNARGNSVVNANCRK